MSVPGRHPKRASSVDENVRVDVTEDTTTSATSIFAEITCRRSSMVTRDDEMLAPSSCTFHVRGVARLQSVAVGLPVTPENLPKGQAMQSETSVLLRADRYVPATHEMHGPELSLPTTVE